MKKETVVYYISDDNERFKTEKECLTHERFLSVKNKIKENVNNFLVDSKNYSYYYEDLEYHIEIYPPHVDNFIRCYIYYIDDEFKYEVDEDFDVYPENWENFVKEIEEDFGFILSLPNYYFRNCK